MSGHPLEVLAESTESDELRDERTAAWNSVDEATKCDDDEEDSNSEIGWEVDWTVFDRCNNEETVYENGMLQADSIQHKDLDNTDISEFDPIPIMKSTTESDDTLSTLTCLLQVSDQPSCGGFH